MAPPGLFFEGANRLQLQIKRVAHGKRPGQGHARPENFEIESSKTPFHGHLESKIALEFPLTACPYFREKSRKSLKTHQITNIFLHFLISAIVAIYQAMR